LLENKDFSRNSSNSIGEVVVAEPHCVMVTVYFYSEFYSCQSFYSKISAILFIAVLPKGSGGVYNFTTALRCDE